MSVEYFDAAQVVLTNDAAKHIKTIVAEKDTKYLRVSITGGGCSGFRYVFNLDEAPQDDDTVVKKHGSAIIIDPMSIQYLAGSTLDYVQTLAGSNFIVSNPLATGTCGCGESFTV